MVLREQARREGVSADYVDHCRQSRRLEQAKTAQVCDIAGETVVLTDHIRRPESRDRFLLTCPRAAVCFAILLDLLERLRPFVALKRRRRIGQKLTCVLEDERPHTAHPRRLRQCEGIRRQAPHAWPWRQR